MTDLVVNVVAKLLARLSSQTRFKLARLTKWVSFNAIRYPCYDYDKVVELSHTEIDGDEQIYYLENSTKRYRVRHLILIVFSIVTYFIYSIVGFSRIYAIDYTHPERNLRKLDNGLTGFGCLATNCKFLSDAATNIGRDLVKFPLFRLCHPRWAPYFPPLVDGGRAPAYFLSILTNGDIVYIGTANILQLISPAPDPPLMYVYAPKTTIKMFRTKIKSILRDISTSWLNERNIMLETYADEYQTATGCSQDEARKYIATNIEDKLDYCREHERMLYASYPHPNQLKNSQLESYVDDCLPGTRTELWRSRAEAVTVVTWFLTVQGAITAPIITIIGIVMFMSKRQALYDGYIDAIASQNCSFWRQLKMTTTTTTTATSDDNSAANLELIDPTSEISTSWSWFAYANTAFISFSSFLAVSQLYALFYLNGVEMIYWFDELSDRIMMLIEIAKLRNIYKLRMSQDSLTMLQSETRRRVHSQFRINSTLDKFLESYGNPFGFYFRKKPINLQPGCGPKLSDKLNRQKSAFEVVCTFQEAELDLVYIELLEKVYINLRTFLDSFESYSTSLTHLGFYSSLVPYVCAFLFLVGLHKAENLPEPYIMLAVILTELVSKIVFGADFHASVIIG